MFFLCIDFSIRSATKLQPIKLLNRDSIIHLSQDHTWALRGGMGIGDITTFIPWHVGGILQRLKEMVPLVNTVSPKR